VATIAHSTVVNFTAVLAQPHFLMSKTKFPNMAIFQNAGFVFFTAWVLLACQTNPKTPADQLGEIHFEVTGRQEAQPAFKKGLLLLHSFEYEDAAEAFQEARKLDPDFAMAWWGEAMTQNHSLWRYQDYEKATAILNALSPDAAGRVAMAKTELERDFMRAVNVLYGKGTKAERDSSYAAFMGQLYEKYPGNDEVTSFYSIALIGSVEIGRDTKVYELAAEKAKEVLGRNPKHPGALHYLIHAYDDPGHASMALQTADAYSVVAPDAGHALHMPTHIYLALGMWDKVISSNIVSWEAGLQRKERKKLSNDALNYHAFHWLQYGYLQQGKKQEALDIFNAMKKYCDELNSDRGREYVIYQKTTYLAETNEYNSPVAEIEVKQDDLNIVTRAMNYFARGMKAYTQKDADALQAIITQLSGERLIDEERIAGAGGKICGSINSAIPNKLDVQQAEVMELELTAMLAVMRNETGKADMMFRQAVDLEKNISYAFGPPTIVKPSFELYGEWLLQQGKPKEALEQFELSLRAAPGRLLSVAGKTKAEEHLKTVAMR
jgi:tetratricopeptide (TPR) repeat protein